MGANLDWLYAVGGWTLIGLAALLGAWALFWDRARGRKRCPKCWYDMSGSPGLLCPECGRESKEARALLRTRRRNRWAVVAIIALVAGYGVRCVPRYRDDGWVALVPSSVLVFIAPAGPSASRLGSSSAAGLLPAPALTVNAAGVITMGPGAAPKLTFGERLDRGAWDRLERGSLAKWQSQAYISRYLKHTGQDPAHGLSLPLRWPVNEPIPAILKSTTPLTTQVRDQSGQWTEYPRVVLAACPRVASEVRIEFGLWRGRTVFTQTTNLPINVYGTRSDFLDRRNDHAANEAAREALAPHLARRNGAAHLIFRDRSDSAVWNRISFATYFSFEVRIGGELVGRGTGVAEWRRSVWKDWEEVTVNWEPGQRERLATEQAVIVVRGIYEPAVAEYLDWPFDKPGPAAWCGEFTMPLEFKPCPGDSGKK